MNKKTTYCQKCENDEVVLLYYRCIYQWRNILFRLGYLHSQHFILTIIYHLFCCELVLFNWLSSILRENFHYMMCIVSSTYPMGMTSIPKVLNSHYTRWEWSSPGNYLIEHQILWEMIHFRIFFTDLPSAIHHAYEGEWASHNSFLFIDCKYYLIGKNLLLRKIGDSL